MNVRENVKSGGDNVVRVDGQRMRAAAAINRVINRLVNLHKDTKKTVPCGKLSPDTRDKHSCAIGNNALRLRP
jgi:hypothetical protein